MFNQVIKLVVKSVSSSFSKKGIEINPLSIEWATHFFVGEGKDKTLPPEAITATKSAVIASVECLWKSPCWVIHTARVGRTDWYTSLAGVVGAFNYSFEKQETGVKVRCYDKWDFNHNSQEIHLPCQNEGVIKMIMLLANQLKIPVSQGEKGLMVSEQDLCILNQKHAFWTRWELFISWEELNFPEGTGPSDYNWKVGGLAHSAIKRLNEQKASSQAPSPELVYLEDSKALCSHYELTLNPDTGAQDEVVGKEVQLEGCGFLKAIGQPWTYYERAIDGGCKWCLHVTRDIEKYGWAKAINLPN